jgi:hypothetical protein
MEVKMSQFIAVVDRFEGDFAVLKHKDHEILLPKEDLPENIEEGSFATIIISSGAKEKKQQKKTESAVQERIKEVLPQEDNQDSQEKVKEAVQEVKEDVGIVTPADRISATFESKPFTQKVQEVFNDILETSVGQEPTYLSPEEKQANALRGVGDKMDKVNRNITEELKEHKRHEE